MLFPGWEVRIAGNCGKRGLENAAREAAFRREAALSSPCHCKNFRSELNELLSTLQIDELVRYSFRSTSQRLF